MLLGTSAEAFSFVEIANTQTSDFTNLNDAAYSINDLGSVVFTAELAGQNGIFLGDGETVGTLVDPSEGFTDFSFVDINSAGNAVFNADGNTGIFSVEGGAINPVVTVPSSLGLIGFTAEGFSSPLINEAGTIVFEANNGEEDQQGLYLVEEDVINTIADSPDFDIFRFSLNNNGEVAFFAISDQAPDGDAVFISDNGGFPVPLPDLLGFGTIEGPTLNDNGTVAFDVLLDDPDPEISLQGIFTQNGEDLQLVVDNSGDFSSFQRPAINNQGTIVFSAGLDAGSGGIFAGPDPVADRVIGIGDTLFGSTVTGVSFTQQTGLNNQGQIAFTASFADGSSGIFRADPDEFQSVPEPVSGVGLLVIGAVGVASRLVKKKR
ncbi:MAG: choice-of-anchor tandem repeat NxxGxxAF-containing protein [Cyanobacteria bacterium P01_G01_bin.49]